MFAGVEEGKVGGVTLAIFRLLFGVTLAPRRIKLESAVADGKDVELAFPVPLPCGSGPMRGVPLGTEATAAACVPPMGP